MFSKCCAINNHFTTLCCLNVINSRIIKSALNLYNVSTVCSQRKSRQIEVCIFSIITTSSPSVTLQWKRLYKNVDSKPTFLVFPHTHWLMSLAVRLAVPKKTITTSFQRGQCQSGHKKTNKSCKTDTITVWLPKQCMWAVHERREKNNGNSKWSENCSKKNFSKQTLFIFQTDGASSSGDTFLLKTNRCRWKSIWKECTFLSKI